MRVLILGGDGYLGWPTAMNLSALGHNVMVVDNYLRRQIAQQTSSEPLFPNPNLIERCDAFREATGCDIKARIADCSDYRLLEEIIRDFQPEGLVHYAEQPSAPYSMQGFEEARLTLNNNLQVTFNVIWAVLEHAPNCHIVKLGTMGEYGTPNIDIEEGWLDVSHNGRNQKFLYPRQGGSLYHTTKVLDTDLLWFYVRTYGLKVTDLMQGPVYGLYTDESSKDRRLLPNFHYDDIFGTVVNRFIVQAVAGVPMTVYGGGGQTRGYLNLKDTLRCVQLALENPVPSGELRILNQFTEQFSVNELAERVVDAAKGIGINATVNSIPNPRKELESHYYNAKHQNLIEMGLKPTLMSTEVLTEMMETVRSFEQLIVPEKILPRVNWNK
ncbi:MAG: NAD-dependent epimerase/dehydratase family protein [Pseudomonadales bacterium]|nr:NAD-dependent epimerase/dehydratase family protein [Pseudomonadales bacterium]MBO7004790.1 NAD-dependent epimerase/dehydratase family protein [Pseudomonadales bacterium]